MTTKPNPLRAAMQGVQSADAQNVFSVVPTPVTQSRPAEAPKAPVASSRAGKRAVSTHVDPAVQKQLRILAAELDRSHQSLLDEALNDLFRKYNKSAIA